MTTMFAPFSDENQPDPVTKPITITPALATEWLGRNMQNRNIRQRKVAVFARKMAAGQWHVTNQGIGFDRDGVLVDGQHRLLAVVAAGVPVRMNVTKNLDPATRFNVDTGTARSVADTLSIAHGTKNASAVASIGARALAWDHGYRWLNNYDSSTEEIDEYVTDPSHDAIHRAAAVSREGAKHVPVQPSLFGTAFYLCARIDPAAAEKFFVEQLIDGVGLSSGDAAQALRKHLAEVAQMKGTTAEFKKLASIISCWNAFRSGKRVQRIKAPAAGWTAENFPEPK